MKTKVKDTKLITALRRRIRQFYLRFNQGDFARCYLMLDPDLRATPDAITSQQYATGLRRFLDWAGQIQIRKIVLIQLHLKEPNRLYNNRDFARLEVVWEDADSNGHTFKERWVRSRGSRWYSRSTGFVVPD